MFNNQNFLYGDKILVIWYAIKRLLHIFSLRTRRNGYLGACGQKFDPAIRSDDLDFLQDGYISRSDKVCSIYLMFLCTIFI